MKAQFTLFLKDIKILCESHIVEAPDYLKQFIARFTSILIQAFASMLNIPKHLGSGIHRHEYSDRNLIKVTPFINTDRALPALVAQNSVAKLLAFLR